MLNENNIFDPKMQALSVRLIKEYESGKRTWNGAHLDRKEATKHVIAVAQDAKNVGASTWETGSQAHRSFVNERTRLLKKKGIDEQDKIDNTINQWLGEMAEVKFGPSK